MNPTKTDSSLVDLMERAVRLHAERPALGSRVAGTWDWVSYRTLGRDIARLRTALAGLGVARGQRVALVSDNRTEWVVTAFAAYGLGAAVVPMYEAQPPSEWEFIARDSGATLLMAASSAIAERCASFQERTALEHVIAFDRPKAAPSSYRGLLEQAGERTVPPIFPASDELAAILYTAGTTGEPKGTRLSHRSIATNVAAIHALLPLASGDRALSCLPWAHAFGFTCELHGLLSAGASIALGESPDRLFEALSEVKPTLIIGVPRLFHQLSERLHRYVDKRPTLIRLPFAKAIELSRAAPADARPVATRVALAAADHLLFAPVRDRLGGRLRWAFSGGAALGREVAEFFDALGIPLYEGYGLTEAGPVVATNHPGAWRIGTVGRPLPGVEVRIEPVREHETRPSRDSDPPISSGRGSRAWAPPAPPSLTRANGSDPPPNGNGPARNGNGPARNGNGQLPNGNVRPRNGQSGEVIVLGPGLMLGYHERPEEDATVRYTDPASGTRGLRTGDLGFLDEDGFLHITGRIKEQYKLANGKYVAPGPIEEALKLSPLVSNAMLYGENRDYNVALVVPNIDALASWAAEHGLACESTGELLASPSVLARILEELDLRARRFKPYERVRKVVLVEEDFTVDNGLLTASLKIRREAILRRHRERLDALYLGDP